MAAAAFERAARLAPDDERRGRLLFAAADAAWLAGSAERAVSLLDEIRAVDASGDRLVRIEHLRGRIAASQGPVMQGYEVLAAAAEQAAEAGRQELEAEEWKREELEHEAEQRRLDAEFRTHVLGDCPSVESVE